MKKSVILMIIVVAGFAAAYEYDANDFAREVIEYVPGDGIPLDRFTNEPFDDPQAALGRPSVDTIGDITGGSPFEPMTILPVYPAFRYYEVVSIGFRGELTVKFNQPVEDNKGNPYGIDLIIFGNSVSIIDGGTYWHRGDNPRTTYITGSHVREEPGIVSVSQDGINWYTFAHKPAEPNDLKDPNHLYADDFAPTLGRIYDPNNPDPGAFPGNQYWGSATNPTIPIDPNLSVADFRYKSLSEICRRYYGESAGGTGFDIDVFDLPRNEKGEKWIQYVKVHNPRYDGATPEIDAFADVSGCGDRKNRYPDGDISRDCVVDYLDAEMLGIYWLSEVSGSDDPALAVDIYRDGVVNFKDWAILAESIGNSCFNCNN